VEGNSLATSCPGAERVGGACGPGLRRALLCQRRYGVLRYAFPVTSTGKSVAMNLHHYW
jgi:hypothetical protein